MIIRTRKLSDKNIVELLRKLFSILPDVSVQGFYAGGASFQVSDLTEFTKIPQKSNERLVESFSATRVSGPSDAVHFARGITSLQNQQQHQTNPFNRFANRDVDAYFDELALFENPNRPHMTGYIAFSSDEKLQISRGMGKFAAPISTSDPTTATALGQLLDQNLADLQRVSIDFLERSAVSREQDEAAYRQRETALEAKFARQNDDLETQKAELESRRTELNDREPQHERRRLREHLTERLQSTIAQPSEKTVQRERFSHYLYLMAATVFVTLSASLTLFQTPGTGAGSPAFWMLSIKSLLSGAAGAAFAWAGLSGLKTTAIADRDYEQSIKRYAFDMDRASWVVETILQMNSSEKATVPDEWLENVCRDLFVNKERDSKEHRSLDAFAALFDATAKARIGTNGIEFEVDRKGARKLAHEA
jgi:hypothetical protein